MQEKTNITIHLISYMSTKKRYAMSPNENPSKTSAPQPSNNTPSVPPSTPPSATSAPSTPDIDLGKPDEKKGFIGNFIDTIKKEIRDLSYMEIITTVGDVNANVNPDLELVIDALKKSELRIIARTRIELDGDIMVLLPTSNNTKDGDITINQEIMALHKENVEVAVHNWNNFMNNMLLALKTIIDITGMSKSQVYDDLSKPVAVENKTTKS
jgi:hypothetical protein